VLELRHWFFLEHARNGEEGRENVHGIFKTIRNAEVVQIAAPASTRKINEITALLFPN